MRRTKPTVLKLIEGNRNKRPLPKHEPKPPPGIPIPPPHLDAIALAEWKSMAVMLFDIGLLSLIDGAILAAYCVAFSRWRQAEEALAIMKAKDKVTNGLLIKTTNGNVIVSPLVGVANRAMMMMIRCAEEFGMSPAARARIAAYPRDKETPDAAQSYF